MIYNNDPLPPPSYTCALCGSKSYNPNDVEHGYCGRCHRVTRGHYPCPRRQCDGIAQPLGFEGPWRCDTCDRDWERVI